MDFYNTIWRLRQDRMHMVQTAEQYIFLHKVVQVAVLCAGTNVQTEDVQDRTSRLDMRTFSGLTYAEKEFTAVCNCIIDGSNYLKGNRKSRVSRYLHQLVDETNLHGRSYTQAPGYKVNLSGQYRKSADNKSVILLPSLTKPNQHMLTPLPVDTPVTNFWTLVLQHRVTVIIAFEPRDSDKQVVSHYLPASKNEVIHCDQMDVEAGTITTGPYWQEHKLTITLRQKKKTKAYDKYHVTHYKYTDDIFNPESVLAFIERVRLGSDQHEKIMFTCLSGAEESGLLYVLTSLLDRLDNDNCINIPLLVGAVKSSHLQVIPTLDYYKVLYKVVNLYVESLLSSSGQSCRPVSAYIQMTSPVWDLRPPETENIYANTEPVYMTAGCPVVRI